MRLPPRAVRRPLQALVLVGGGALVVAALPILVLLAALAGLRWGSGPLRLLAFGTAFLALELVGALAAVLLWVGGRARDQRLHLDVLRALLDEVLRAARVLLRLRVVTDPSGWSPVDDGVPGSEGALVVLSRHAGAGDSLVLVRTLLDPDHLRRPRVVLKDLLRLDPVVDGFLGRLPSAFLPAGSRTAHVVADVARDLGDDDALVLFPEGANATPRRRVRAVEGLRRKGLVEAAAAAARLRHVLPARPGGVAAALTAAPDADVLVVTHTGLEALDSVGGLLRGLPLRAPVVLHFARFPAAEVPRDPEAVRTWLQQRWQEVDDRVAAGVGGPSSAAAAAGSGD